MTRGRGVKKPVRRVRVVAGRHPKPVAAAEPVVTRPAASPPENAVAVEIAPAEVEPPLPAPTETVPEPGEPTSEAPVQRRFPLVPVLSVVLVVAIGFVIWAAVATQSLRPGGNVALVDNATTDVVLRQVTDAVRDTFSYDHADTGRTEQAAARVLDGRAIEQYRELFAEVRKVAPAQKLVLTTTIRAAGVREIQGDTATLLIFVDQQMLRTGDNVQNSGAAQLEITARRDGPNWRIVELKVL
ncbi:MULTISPECIES: hypothetical protein [unclassified Crossiella]|uniref:hypothetical protein n=1 Tax=unclassified Crossiella TaxID=2620835 RepID=UPI001FFECCCA|nr:MULTISPECIES: hypothetical protein [unclassified Crossiella]MCK2241992.1 hypothetical protein [Crossiella sp. S99.2]MCK2255895.1 hypothetical protein [Crossiella sp. S99.1]